MKLAVQQKKHLGGQILYSSPESGLRTLLQKRRLGGYF